MSTKTKTVVAVANYSGAMEPETIKNGASPKSLTTSRGNFYRSLCSTLAACIFIGVMFTGCKKDDDDDAGVSSGKIEAKVENGRYYDDYIDEVLGVMYYNDWSNEYTAAEGKYARGAFSLQLPSSVNNRYLCDVFEVWEYMEDFDVSISDYSARMNIMWFEGYENYDYVGDFVHFKYEEKKDYQLFSYAEYVYVDKNVTIKYSSSGTDDGYRWQETVNLPLKKGWNILYTVYEETAKELKYSWTTNNPRGLRWYFEDDIEDIFASALRSDNNIISPKSANVGKVRMSSIVKSKMLKR